MSKSCFGNWVPLLKQTVEAPDFTLLEKRISELIAGDEDAAQHADALKEQVLKLASMRAACIMPRQLDEAALEALKEYFRILRMLQRRVSSSKIIFKWRCTLTPQGGGLFSSDPSVSKGGLGLEMRAVAYQIGVCCAAIASRLSEGQDAGDLPKAAKWYKNAYFVFNYARDFIEVDLLKDCELNKDLKPDVLLALSRVMLAQAANVFQLVMTEATIARYGKITDPVQQHEKEKLLFQFAIMANITYRSAREKIIPLFAEYPPATLECTILEQCATVPVVVSPLLDFSCNLRCFPNRLFSARAYYYASRHIFAHPAKLKMKCNVAIKFCERAVQDCSDALRNLHSSMSQGSMKPPCRALFLLLHQFGLTQLLRRARGTQFSHFQVRGVAEEGNCRLGVFEEGTALHLAFT